MGSYAEECIFNKNSADNTECVVSQQLRLYIESEEQCGNCGNVFTTKTSVTKCPECGEPVVSCNACISCNGDCGDCSGGDRFQENYHVIVKYREGKGGIIYSDNLYHTGFLTGSLEDLKERISRQYKGGRITYEECKI